MKKYLKKGFSSFLPTFVAMKLLTDTDYIHALIAEGEHQQQDFKFGNFRRTQNSQNIIGLCKHRRRTIAYRREGQRKNSRRTLRRKKYMIEAAAQLYCIPEVEYTMQTYIVEGRQVLVATIEETPTNRYTPKTKTESLSPTSASKMKIYWQLLSTSVYGNKATVHGEN